MNAHLVIKPRISEKSYFLSEGQNTYMFDVPVAANKLQIKQAVEEQFNVSVTAVRTAIAKGKCKTTPLRGRYPITGQRKDVKKAYVTLALGDSLPLFEDL